jgi:membrane-bound ClpP family serine protease
VIEWITVISLISFGLILIVAEVIVIPGTTIVGILGFLFLIIGIAFSFKYFGSETGWVTVGVSAVSAGVILYYSFKADVWSRFSSKTKIDSRVNEGELDSLKVGDEGVTISSLRPVGKAELNGKLYEVKSFGDYLDNGIKIKIIKINSSQIIVEPII